MNYDEFFSFFSAHAAVVLMYIVLATGFLFFAIRKVAIAGVLDPIHLIWTFTFGTTYGLVLSFFHYSLISFDVLFFIIVYLMVFLLVINFLCRRRYKGLSSSFLALTASSKAAGFKVKVIAMLLLLLVAMLIVEVGFNAFTETNRFESNRGFGPIVVYAKILSLFLVGFWTISLLVKHRARFLSGGLLLKFAFLLCFCVFLTLLFGAKAELLSFFYAMFVATSLYYGKIKRPLLVGFLALGVALPFALLILIFNLEGHGVDAFADGNLMPGIPMFLQRFFQRVLSNGDQVYLGLPYGVIEQLKTDSVFVRLASPLLGNSFMSGVLGYDVSQFNVGRQALLYHYPDFAVAGGPTDHFDLFAYKYFGPYFGYLWAIVSAIVLAFISSLAPLCRENIYRSALVSTLWLTALSLLLAPPVGIARLIQAVLLFFLINSIFSTMIRKSTLEEHNDSI